MKDDCASDVITCIVLFYCGASFGGAGQVVRKTEGGNNSHLNKCESEEHWSFYE